MYAYSGEKIFIIEQGNWLYTCHYCNAIMPLLFTLSDTSVYYVTLCSNPLLMGDLHSTCMLCHIMHLIVYSSETIELTRVTHYHGLKKNISVQSRKMWPSIRNRAYVHKIHFFAIWYISPLLFKILKFCNLHLIPYKF